MRLPAMGENALVCLRRAFLAVPRGLLGVRQVAWFASSLFGLGDRFAASWIVLSKGVMVRSRQDASRSVLKSFGWSSEKGLCTFTHTKMVSGVLKTLVSSQGQSALKMPKWCQIPSVSLFSPACMRTVATSG